MLLISQMLILVTGGFGFILMPLIKNLFPNVSIKWADYFIVPVIGLIVGGFQIFTKLTKEKEKEKSEFALKLSALEERVREFENKKPQIAVGFIDKSGHPTQRLQIQLNALPPIPLIDELIKKKRDELLLKKQSLKTDSYSSLEMISGLVRSPNRHYDREVEEYLDEYSKYIFKSHEYAIIKDRTHYIALVVENQGLCPANNVIIELEMPMAYKRPNIQHDPEINLFLEGEIDLCPPEEPRLLKESNDLSDYSKPSQFLKYIEMPNCSMKQQNASGPEFKDRSGVQIIEYHFNKFIPKQDESDFSPFLLWLKDFEQSTSWEIPLKIYAEELPYPLEQTLRIDFIISEPGKQL